MQDIQILQNLFLTLPIAKHVNMKYILSLILVSFLIACGNSTKENPKIATNNPQIAVKATDTTQTQFPTTKKWDKTTVIGEATLWRNEEIEGSNEWKTVHATNVFGFKKDIAKEEIIQVIPLTKELPILGLKVTETTKRDDFDGEDIWYEVELEVIKNNEYWSYKGPKERRAEYPIDLLVVYPAIENATLLTKHDFSVEELPKNVSNTIIKGALDFDNDQLPDAIVCEFCCSDRSSATDCEYFCGEIYIKVNGQWILINSSQPA